MIPCAVHRSLITPLQARIPIVIKETSPSVTSLCDTFRADNIKDETIAREFLVCFDLEEIAALDFRPIGHHKFATLFPKNEPFNRLVVYGVGCIFQLLVG